MGSICGPGRPSKQLPPPELGPYRIRDRDGNHKYHGTTEDLCRRSKEHEKSGLYDKQAGDTFEWQLCQPGTTPEQRYEHERRKAEQHQPYANRRRGGGGRRPSG